MKSTQPAAEVIDRVAGLLQSRIGLRPDPFLRSRLGRSIRDEAALHHQEVDEYVRKLFSSDGALQGLLNRVTVQETGFFRHPEHFAVLARDILPTLIQPIKIWSAGCANGQEAFSLAMLFDEHGIDGSVIATDLSTAALERTTAARYATRELTGLSTERIDRHLTQTRSAWQVNDSIRSRVSTLRHNLMSPLPDQIRACQIVFCRNVLIYFSPQHTKAFLDRVAETMPTTWVFLGSAETIWTVSDRYETVRIGDSYIYRPLAVSRPTSAETAVHGIISAKAPAAFRTVPPSRGGKGRRTNSSGGISSTPQRANRSVNSPQSGSVVPNTQTVALIAKAGQQSLSAGDHAAAIVQFRKWVFLAEDDAVAHLHLGLALEASGDTPSAQRAFGASRRALQTADSSGVQLSIGGYGAAELLRLLDDKQEVLAP